MLTPDQVRLRISQARRSHGDGYASGVDDLFILAYELLPDLVELATQVRRPDVPISDDDLDEIEERSGKVRLGGFPCSVADLIGEIRRLRRGDD